MKKGLMLPTRISSCKINHLLCLWQISMQLMIVTADNASNNIALRRHLMESLL
jgi:hypothetical protein